MKFFWTGTDVLMMTDISKRKLRKYPYLIFFRLAVRILDRLSIEGHITNCELLKQELETVNFKRPIEIIPTPILYKDPVVKIPHSGFNVLYYKPYRKDSKFRDWLYGIDLIEQLKKDIPEVNYIEVGQGFNKNKDMREVYPIVDFYVRPNRHDGLSKMVRECNINNIPFYWSQTNPNYDEMLAAVKTAIIAKNEK